MVQINQLPDPISNSTFHLKLRHRDSFCHEAKITDSQHFPSHATNREQMPKKNYINLNFPTLFNSEIVTEVGKSRGLRDRSWRIAFVRVLLFRLPSSAPACLAPYFEFAEPKSSGVYQTEKG